MTIVLPDIRVTGPYEVAHEIGHALDCVIGFDHDPIAAVCDFALRDDWEAFACAYTTWLYWTPGDEDVVAQDVLARDKQTVALFERLSA